MKNLELKTSAPEVFVEFYCMEGRKNLLIRNNTPKLISLSRGEGISNRDIMMKRESVPALKKVREKKEAKFNNNQMDIRSRVCHGANFSNNISIHPFVDQAIKEF